MNHFNKRLLFQITLLLGIIFFVSQNDYIKNLNLFRSEIKLKGFIIDPAYSICSNKDVYIITVVIVKPGDFERRALIRRTWGDPRWVVDFKVVFLVGLSAQNTTNNLIIEESKAFKDIIQLDYLDSYFNLTTKVMRGFKWASTYCSNTKYILRINDDVVVNKFDLVKYLRNVTNENKYNTNNLMIGWYFARGQVIRMEGHKFYISYEQFKQNFYDPYVEGSAYIISTSIGDKFYNLSASVYMPPFSDWYFLLLKFYG